MRNSSHNPEDLKNYVERLSQAPFPQPFELAHKKAQDLNKSPLSITALEGRILSFLVSQAGCKNFVEIGTLTGFSALWIAAGMGVGKLWTLEKDPVHAQAAREVFQQYRGQVQIHLLEGDARNVLQELSLKGPFDGVFIDGNKSAYLDYLNWCEAHVVKGGLILADNIFLRGSVWGVEGTPFSEKQVKIMKEFNQRLSDPEKYHSCVLPTFDGIFAAVKMF